MKYQYTTNPRTRSHSPEDERYSLFRQEALSIYPELNTWWKFLWKCWFYESEGLIRAGYEPYSLELYALNIGELQCMEFVKKRMLDLSDLGTDEDVLHLIRYHFN